MSVAIYQNYSNNNYSLFKTTLQNHVEYCNKHGYSLVLDNSPYSTYMDSCKLYNVLCSYGYVMTIGSDCVFTNKDITVESILPEGKSVAMAEELKPNGTHFINGEIILIKQDSNTEHWFELMDKIQGDKASSSFQYRIGLVQNSLPNYFYIPPRRTLQSYYGNPYGPAENSVWREGDYIAHAIGGSNEDKEKRCKELLAKIK